MVKKITRAEATEQLLRLGYVPEEYPGIWIAPNGDKLAWFIALCREGIKFDSKTWGAEITRVKYEWNEKKRAAKLKNK